MVGILLLLGCLFVDVLFSAVCVGELFVMLVCFFCNVYVSLLVCCNCVHVCYVLASGLSGCHAAVPP